jgi:hypothetical protein
VGLNLNTVEADESYKGIPKEKIRNSPQRNRILLQPARPKSLAHPVQILSG